MANKAQLAKLFLKVLILGFAVIFVGGELADALIAQMPDQVELIKTCVAAVVGAIVIVIAIPLLRRRSGVRGAVGKDDPPT